MRDTVADTGPILHLREINRLPVLAVVAPLVLPELVMEELEARGAGSRSLQDAGIGFAVSPVEEAEWIEVIRTIAPQIQPADAQVFALVHKSGFGSLALTDDLALRRVLETYGTQVTGSFGILIRAYRSGVIQRGDLEGAVDDLFDRSTLHVSSAFRLYVKQLLVDLN